MQCQIYSNIVVNHFDWQLDQQSLALISCLTHVIRLPIRLYCVCIVHVVVQAHTSVESWTSGDRVASAVSSLWSTNKKHAVVYPKHLSLLLLAWSFVHHVYLCNNFRPSTSKHQHWHNNRITQTQMSPGFQPHSVLCRPRMYLASQNSETIDQVPKKCIYKSTSETTSHFKGKLGAQQKLSQSCCTMTGTKLTLTKQRTCVRTCDVTHSDNLGKSCSQITEFDHRVVHGTVRYDCCNLYIQSLYC